MIVSHLLLILHKKIQFYIFVWSLKCAKGRKVQGGRILSQGTVHTTSISLTKRCLYVASLVYIACLFTVVLFIYLPIVHLTPFLHYWLGPVGKVYYTCCIRRMWQIHFDLIWSPFWQYFEKLNEKEMKYKLCQVEFRYSNGNAGATLNHLQGMHRETQTVSGRSALDSFIRKKCDKGRSERNHSADYRNDCRWYAAIVNGWGYQLQFPNDISTLNKKCQRNMYSVGRMFHVLK